MIDIDKSLEIAKDAALLAGKFLISANNDAQKILGDDGRDIKLQIDQDAENLITEYISTRSNLPILGEEFGHKGNLGSDFWVIDPLDGTSNYFRNIPICAVSIALMHNNEPILGVINDFFSENLYFASKEKGAFVNNKRINVSNKEKNKDPKKIKKSENYHSLSKLDLKILVKEINDSFNNFLKNNSNLDLYIIYDNLDLENHVSRYKNQFIRVPRFCHPFLNFFINKNLKENLELISSQIADLDEEQT